MPSAEHFVKTGDLASLSSLANRCWSSFATANSLQALLVVRYDAKCQNADVQWSHNLPAEAFNGSEKQHVIKVLDECFLVHPKPHVHALKHEGLPKVVCRLNKNIKEQYRAWFFPAQMDGNFFVFLGFPEPDNGKGLPSDLGEQLSMVFSTLNGCLKAHERQNRLEVTEKFVKEVGHDVASAVQACVAKLRAISDGRVTGNATQLKSREVEQEIWGIYRVAESLGIVADPNYEVRTPRDFDLNESIQTVIQLFSAEANERHIRLKSSSSKEHITIWGDKAALQQAIGQLVHNAIKYGFGGTDVNIFTAEREDDILIRVTNKGHPLPDNPERKQIWDFGYRGKTAIEKHVNGSGIGLFTAKKIVTAHLGWTDADSKAGYTEVFIHLPKRAALKRDLGFLI